MKLLSMDELRDRGISYSKAHLWRRISAGTFPKPIRLGVNRIAFLEVEIDAWLNERIAERDAGEAA